MNKHEIKHLIQRLKGHHSPVRIEDIITTKNAYDTDLQNLLELLCYTHDVEIKIKVFSTLAAYLLSKKVDCKRVVTHLPVYDEIQNVIREGLYLSNTSVLYFVSSLLSFDVKNGSQQNSLVIFAQNALRVSGCLATMAELFTRNMMYQDSWIALCRSVAEACRGSELNQSYCSNLVPVCVRKCFQGNMEACLVLQSLLLNHDRNIQLFLDYNGTTIFSRKTLQYDMCLLLLDNIVQRSQRAATMLLETDVVYNLREYLDLYGPESKIGQWSTVILYHINSSCKNDTIKDNEIEMDTNTEKNNYTPKNIADNSLAKGAGKDADGFRKNETLISRQHDPDDTKELLQNIIREMAYWKKEKEKRNITMKEQARHELTNTTDQRKNDDTEVLLQNIAGEIAHGKSLQAKKNAIVNDQLRKVKTTMNAEQTPKAGPAQNRYTNILMSQNSTHKMAGLKENLETDCYDLSFSFLLNQNNYMKRSNVRGTCTDQDKFVAKPNLTTRQFSNNFLNKSTKIQNQERKNDAKFESLNSITGNQSSRDDLSSALVLRRFKPSFASTPKRKMQTMSLTKSTQHSRSSTKISQLSRPTFKSRPTHWHLESSRFEKESNKSVATSVKKRQSMSARLFTAINESCTTFVKSVKGIFKGSSQASQNNPKTDNSERELDALTCSFSFTNYMRKRDAILDNNGTKMETGYYNSIEEDNKTKSFNCCNETAFLRHKLASDEHLKETLKKLKYGIKLHGRDFKKISKALWPNDKAITHRVLYQLHQKLLAK